MLSRRGRAWLALTILVTLVVPAVGSFAGSKDKLEKIDRELDALQDEIEQQEAAAGSVEEEADAINRSMIRLRSELTKLEAEIADIESAVRSAQARIDALQARIDKLEKVATRQAISLYKSGATETLDALLNARSLTELDNRVEMLGVAAQQNTGALIQFGRLQVEVQAAHQDLFEEKQQLEAARDKQSTLYALMDEKHEKLQEKLAAIEAGLDRNEAHEGSLLSAKRSIEAEILKRTTLASVAVLGKSTKGYIWPLNGAITSYYGPRWGRMHTGLDIDGTTGQPIVASNSGTVIMAAPYSGYGNCVIIDHGGVQTLYAHMNSINVSQGQQVSQGEIVGTVGATGNVTGDHLHFEVRVNGSPVDPMSYLP